MSESEPGSSECSSDADERDEITPAQIFYGYEHYQRSRKWLVKQGCYLGILNAYEINEILLKGAYNGGHFLYEDYEPDLTKPLVLNLVFPHAEHHVMENYCNVAHEFHKYAVYPRKLGDDLWSVRIFYGHHEFRTNPFYFMTNNPSANKMEDLVPFLVQIHGLIHECYDFGCTTPCRRNLGLSDDAHSQIRTVKPLYSLSSFIVRNFFHHARKMFEDNRELPEIIITDVFDKTSNFDFHCYKP